MKNIKFEADFVFVKNGNVFFIEKDRYNWLYPFVALDGYTIQGFLESEYKTTVVDTEGKVIAQNFKNLNLNGVQDILSEVEQSYNQKLDLIDMALAKGDKEMFMMVTNELYN